MDWSEACARGVEQAWVALGEARPEELPPGLARVRESRPEILPVSFTALERCGGCPDEGRMAEGGQWWAVRHGRSVQVFRGEALQRIWTTPVLLTAFDVDRMGRVYGVADNRLVHEDKPDERLPGRALGIVAGRGQQAVWCAGPEERLYRTGRGQPTKIGEYERIVAVLWDQDLVVWAWRRGRLLAWVAEGEHRATGYSEGQAEYAEVEARRAARDVGAMVTFWNAWRSWRASEQEPTVVLAWPECLRGGVQEEREANWDSTAGSGEVAVAHPSGEFLRTREGRLAQVVPVPYAHQPFLERGGRWWAGTRMFPGPAGHGPRRTLLVWGDDPSPVAELDYEVETLVRPFAPDGSWLAVAQAVRGRGLWLRRLALPGGGELQSVQLEDVDYVRWLSVASDGRILLQAWDGRLALWEWATERLTWYPPGTWCPGPRATVFRWHREGGLFQLNPEEGDRRITEEAAPADMEPGRVVAGGDWLCLNRSLLVHVGSGQLLRWESPGRLLELLLGPQGERFVALSETTVDVYELPALRQLSRRPNDGWNRMGLAADGRSLVLWHSGCRAPARHPREPSFLTVPGLQPMGGLQGGGANFQEVWMVGPACTLTLGPNGELRSWRHLGGEGQALAPEDARTVRIRACRDPKWRGLAERLGLPPWDASLALPQDPWERAAQRLREAGRWSDLSLLLTQGSPALAARMLAETEGLPGLEEARARRPKELDFKLLREVSRRSLGSRSSRFSPDGAWLIAGSKAWATDSDQELSLPAGNGHFALGPEGLLAWEEPDSVVGLWDLPGASRRGQLSVSTQRLAGLCLSPDGGWLYSAQSDHSKTVLRRWDPQGRLVGPERELRGQFVSMRLCPRGRWLWARTYEQCWLLAADTLLPAWESWSAGGTEAFCPEGEWLALGNDHPRSTEIRLLEAASGRLVATLEGNPYGVSGFCFSPDRVHLAVSLGGNQCLRLWNLSDPRPTPELDTGYFGGMAWSPDGSSLALGMGNAVLALWSPRRRRVNGVAVGGSDGISSLCFGRDGHLHACSGDGTLTRYEISSDLPLRSTRAALEPWLRARGSPRRPCDALSGGLTLIETEDFRDGENGLWDFVRALLAPPSPPEWDALARELALVSATPPIE